MITTINDLKNCTDEELKELAQQALRLNKNGGTEEQPLRYLIDTFWTPNAVLVVSMEIFFECTKRWVDYERSDSNAL